MNIDHWWSIIIIKEALLVPSSTGCGQSRRKWIRMNQIKIQPNKWRWINPCPNKRVASASAQTVGGLVAELLFDSALTWPFVHNKGRLEEKDWHIFGSGANGSLAVLHSQGEFNHERVCVCVCSECSLWQSALSTSWEFVIQETILIQQNDTHTQTHSRTYRWTQLCVLCVFKCLSVCFGWHQQPSGPLPISLSMPDSRHCDMFH